MLQEIVGANGDMLCQDIKEIGPSLENQKWVILYKKF